MLAAAAAVFLVAAVLVGWTLWQRSLRPSPAPEASPVASPSPAAALSLRGSLRVESEPSGARVVVNGSARGETPLVLGELPLGPYQVRLELKGFEAQTQEVTLGAESPAAQLRATLTRSAAGAPLPLATTGTADVASTPPGAEVAIDGQAAGKTPLAGLRLRPGRHRVEIDLDQHETWTGTVDVTAGARARVEAKLRPAPKPNAPPTPEPVDTSRVYENRPGDVDVLARKVSGVSPSYPSGAPRAQVGREGVGPRGVRGNGGGGGAGRDGAGVRGQAAGRGRGRRHSQLEVPAGDEARHAREGSHALQADVPGRLGRDLAKLIVNPTSANRREIPLSRSSILTIGRDPSNDLVLPDAMVSRRHAVLEQRGSQFFIRDCNSANGSVVNGDRVSERALA